MLRKTIYSILIITLTLCVAQVWAKTMYVTDSFEITLRGGTSTRHKILAILSSNIPKSFIIRKLQKKLKAMQEELTNLRKTKKTLENSNSELKVTLRSHYLNV
ncbi:MAG: hypothetical protein J7J44_08285 [Deltaproteobacteria bacterium]|nr:hypothetical protein [Deltaproteobacteria bacterium]